jgi:hypothetical protein
MKDYTLVHLINQKFPVGKKVLKQIPLCCIMVDTMDKETVQLLENIKTVAEKYPDRFFDAINSLSWNQFRSKTWLLEKLNQYPHHFKNKTKDSIDIAVLGGWYGFMADLLQKDFHTQTC